MNAPRRFAATALLLAACACFAVATPGCTSSTENTVAPPAAPDSPEVAAEKAAHYGGSATKPSG